MKILIAYPPLSGPGFPTLGQNRQFQWLHRPSRIYPLVPASAATLLATHGYHVLWKDAIAQGWSWGRFERYAILAHPDMVVMETKTPVVKQHWRIIDSLKGDLPNAKFVLTGDHVTALPRETLEKCPVDYVLTGGDCDISLLGLVKHLCKGAELPAGIWHREGGEIANTGPFEPCGEPVSLPFIDRDLTDCRLYGERLYRRTPFTYTYAGRDCPHGRCTFCSWTSLFPKFRIRSPRSLADEIERLVVDRGVREIFDDTGTLPAGEWLERFCAEMIRRKLGRRVRVSCNFRSDYLLKSDLPLMKRAGFRLMKIGLESANQQTLDRLEKGLEIASFKDSLRAAKRAGLEIHLTVMLGYPWERREDAERTVRFARECMSGGLADMLQATIIVPYPGTPLYKEALENGWFRIAPDDYDRFDMSSTVLKTPDMSPEDVISLCNRCYGGFLSPGYIRRQIKSIRSFYDIRFLMRGANAVFGHLADFSKKGRGGG